MPEEAEKDAKVSRDRDESIRSDRVQQAAAGEQDVRQVQAWAKGQQEVRGDQQEQDQQRQGQSRREACRQATQEGQAVVEG